MDKKIFFKILKFTRPMPFLSSSNYYNSYIFFHWATEKCVHFMGRKGTEPSFLCPSPCLSTVFSYENVNVNMYFEAVLLLVGSLSH